MHIIFALIFIRKDTNIQICVVQPVEEQEGGDKREKEMHRKTEREQKQSDFEGAIKLSQFGFEFQPLHPS